MTLCPKVVITIVTTTRGRQNDGRPLSRSEAGRAGNMTRLRTENWDAMIAPALASPAHVSKIDRWRKIADETNPGLSPDQRERLAEKLRTEFYRDMGRRSAESRRLARQRTAGSHNRSESDPDTDRISDQSTDQRSDAETAA